MEASRIGSVARTNMVRCSSHDFTGMFRRIDHQFLESRPGYVSLLLDECVPTLCASINRRYGVDQSLTLPSPIRHSPQARIWIASNTSPLGTPYDVVPDGQRFVFNTYPYKRSHAARF